ncbi:MAG: Na+/H+ antiporter NhaA [Thermoanaerobaculia bacterium]|nr:Na+/H+ antiporter NhaA [Thermoanaerobaculia bacterium]
MPSSRRLTRRQLRTRESPVPGDFALFVQRNLHRQEASGAMLLIAAAAALAIANSPWSEAFSSFWHHTIPIDLKYFEISLDLRHWINDALMALFFFQIGLEIKRELIMGELSEIRKAMFPAIAAIGGMVLPVGIFLAWTAGSDGTQGWAVPMATDIAFALGVLALLGDRISPKARVFLLTLATVDDIGSILVIAIVFTSDLSWAALGASLIPVGIILILRYLGVRLISPYFIAGILLWVGILRSGIHPTIAGVIVGLLIPAKPRISHEEFLGAVPEAIEELEKRVEQEQEEEAEGILGEIEQYVDETISPVERLEYHIRPWVSYIVLPLFALANAQFEISLGGLGEAITKPVTLGIATGLLLGKPIGTLLFGWSAEKLGVGTPPEGVDWKDVIGIGMIAGIGFTVSLFIANLAFSESELIHNAKLGILIGSVLSAIAGTGFLFFRSAQEKE